MVKRIGDMRLDGRNPLGYMGVRPYTPPQMIVLHRAPTTNDYQGLSLGTQWTHKVDSNPTNSIQYVLVDLSGGVATWLPINNGGPLPTLPQYQVVLGTGVPGLTTVGSLGTTGQILTSQGPNAAPIWSGSGGDAFQSINLIVIDTPGNGTYTPTAGMSMCTVECIGGGGGANGIQGIPGFAGGFISPGSGGGGGAYCKKTYTSTEIGVSQTYTVGDLGAGGIGAISQASPIFIAGTNGGDTTFGAGPTLITAGGGIGGVDTPLNPPNATMSAGGIATGGDLNIDGSISGYPFFSSLIGLQVPLAPAQFSVSGYGGNSALGYGFGGSQIAEFANAFGSNGYSAVGYGGGGGAGWLAIPQAPPQTHASTGGDGSQGLIIITEYIN